MEVDILAKSKFERVERKFRLSSAQRTALIAALEGHMVPDKYAQYTICSIYYDSPDYLMLRRSLEKPVYKEKLRLRFYGVPEPHEMSNAPVFIELKKKFQGVVYKRRIKLTLAQAVRFLSSGMLEVVPREDCSAQVVEELRWVLRQYKPVPAALIAYDRTAWVGVDDPSLRLTIDLNIRARDTGLHMEAGDGGTLLLPEGDGIMEIKTQGGLPMWLTEILSREKIYSSSFSKVGTYMRQREKAQHDDAIERKPLAHVD